MTSSHWSYFTSQINLHNSAEILRVLIVPVKTSEDSHLPGAVDAADWGYSRGSQQPGGLGPSEGQEGSLPGTGKVLLRGQTRSLQGHEAPLPAPARQLATSVCLSISVPCNLHPSLSSCRAAQRRSYHLSWGILRPVPRARLFPVLAGTHGPQLRPRGTSPPGRYRYPACPA